ncbi:protein unc-93 homolog A-like isoform X2 [Tubulanus polymorphus]|uniref:protein unc-93 homolog A-like isoform X2 n=1 Tax=Tubulanus polymorphus TaxID=672921 RepID=UPI003DA6CA42
MDDRNKFDFDTGPRLRRSNDAFENDEDTPVLMSMRTEQSTKSKCASCRAKSFSANLPPQPAHLAALAEYDDDDEGCECDKLRTGAAQCQKQKFAFVVDGKLNVGEDKNPVRKFIRLTPEDESLANDRRPYGSIYGCDNDRLLLTTKVATVTTSVLSNDHLPMISEAALGSHVSVAPPVSVMKLAKIAHLLQKDQLPNRRIYVKNFIFICMTFSLAFMSFFSLRTLQSSLNPGGGLGLVSLSCFYGSYVIGCVTAPAIMNKIRPKWTIFFSLWGQLMFNAANFYPKFYTMVPGSILAGYTCALLLVAQGTYLASIAASFSIVTERNIENVMTMFFGIFTLFLQSGQILGNLISSLILQAEQFIERSHLVITVDADAVNSTEHIINKHVLFDEESTKSWNKSICGARYCHSYNLDSLSDHVSRQALYVLLIVYSAAIVLALIISALWLDKLDIIFQSSKTTKTIAQQLRSMGSFYKKVKMLLMLPLICYSSFMQSFVFGDAVKAYITCTIGIKMVGYTVVCYGVSSSISALFVGLIRKYTGRPFIILSAVFCLCLVRLFGSHRWNIFDRKQ